MQATALPYLAYRLSGRPLDLGLIAGDISMYTGTPGAVIPHGKSGALRLPLSGVEGRGYRDVIPDGGDGSAKLIEGGRVWFLEGLQQCARGPIEEINNACILNPRIKILSRRRNKDIVPEARHRVAEEVQASGGIRGWLRVQEGLEQVAAGTVEQVGCTRVTSSSAVVDRTYQRIQSHCPHRGAKAGKQAGRANGPHQVSVTVELVDGSATGGSAFPARPNQKRIPNDPHRFAKEAASRRGGA